MVLAALAVVFIPMFLKGSKPVPKHVLLTNEATSTSATSSTQTILTEQGDVLSEQGSGATPPIADNASAAHSQSADQLAFGDGPLPIAVAPLPAPVPVSVPKQTQTIAKAKKKLVAVAPKIVKTKTVAAAKPVPAKRPINIAQLVDLDGQVMAEQQASSKHTKLTSTKTTSTNTQSTVAAPSAPSTPVVNQTSSASAWVVQLGSFSSASNAKKLAAELRDKGFAAYTREIKTADGSMMRVFIGPEIRRDWAETIKTKLNSDMHLKAVVVAFESPQIK